MKRWGRRTPGHQLSDPESDPFCDHHRSSLGSCTAKSRYRRADLSAPSHYGAQHDLVVARYRRCRSHGAICPRDLLVWTALAADVPANPGTSQARLRVLDCTRSRLGSHHCTVHGHGGATRPRGYPAVTVRQTTIGWYVLAAIAEIAGCFAFWAVLRLERSPSWLAPGVLSLIVFAYALEADKVLVF